jgi:hypothetical protein
MDRITGFAALPPTLSSVSSRDTSTAMATAALNKTVTKTVTRTLSVAVRATNSAVTANNNLGPHAPISDVPAHILNQVTRLYAKAPNFRQFRNLLLMSPALKMLLGAAVAAGGVAALCKWLPVLIKRPPPGEDHRTWKDKINYAYIFLKNTARENEQLRKDITKASEERDQAQQDREILESTYTGTDTESIKLKREMNNIKKQVPIYEQQVHALRLENTNLGNSLAQRNDQTQHLLQARQNEADLGDHLSHLLPWAIRIQNQVVQLEGNKDSLDVSLERAHGHASQLQVQLNTALGQRNQTRRELALEQAQTTELVMQTHKQQQEIIQLQEQLQTAQASVKGAEELPRQCDEYRNEVQRLQQALDQTGAALNEVNELYQVSAQLEEEIQKDLDAEKREHEKAKNDLEAEKQQGKRAENDFATEKQQREKAEKERKRAQGDVVYLKAQLNVARSGRKPGPPTCLTAAPSQSAVNSHRSTPVQLKPSTAIHKAGLDASPPLIPSSVTRDPVPETPSFQIKKEAAATPASSSSSMASDGTPSCKRSRSIKDDGNSPPKKIKSEPNSDDEPMVTNDQAGDNVILDTDDQAPDDMILDAKGQPTSSPNFVFKNLPVFRRPDQASSSPELRSSSPPGPPPPRPSAPTPHCARGFPSVALGLPPTRAQAHATLVSYRL